MDENGLKHQAAAWRERYQQSLKKPRKESFATDSGIPVKELYTPLDLAEQGFSYNVQLGFPGEYPFTRGSDIAGYRNKIYGIGQYAGFATAKETNRLFKKLIAEGQDSLHVACDLPTNMGYDVDHPMAEGEIGRVGLTVTSLADMEEFLDGIDLNQIGVTYVVNPISPVILAMHVAVAKKQGVPLEKLTGCVQNDVMKEYTSCGKYIFPPRQAVRLSADIIEFVTEKMPRFYANNIALYHMGEAGADEIQQVAFALGAAIEYCDEVTRRGVPIDDFAPNIAFLGYINHRNLLGEVAKIRAMRWLWASLLKERYGARKPESMTLKMHGAQGGIYLTAAEGYLNYGRITLSALAAALAGVQSLGLRTIDEPYGIPSEEASIASIRMAQMVAHETGAMDTIDPLAGSYFVESMTREIKSRVEQKLNIIEKMGGLVNAIESGYVSKEISDSAYTMHRDLERGAKTLLGYKRKDNSFKSSNQAPYYLPSDEIEKQCLQRLDELRRNRDNERVQKALNQLRICAEDSRDLNMMVPILEAVEAYATMGEIHGVLRKVFGEYHMPNLF